MLVRGPHCGGCPFEHTGTIFIPSDGTGSNGILLVGDSGWTYEASTLRQIDGLDVGTPFSGPSGWFIDRNLKRLLLSRSDFLISNTCWCKAPRLGAMDAPERNPDAAQAIEHCRPYLDALIAERKPKVIIPLGNVALRRVTGLTGIEALHGYILETPYGIPAIPSFHPSYLLRGNQKLSGLWNYVIKKALGLAQAPALPLSPYASPVGVSSLVLDPSTAEAEEYLGEARVAACDIETDYGNKDDDKDVSYNIVRIGFSVKPGTAISMPWAFPYDDIARRFLSRLETTIFWNQAFDVPRLRASGCEVNGVVDAMWLWHWLQSDLPKKLSFVAPLYLNIQPWKHLSGEQPAFYNAMDNRVTLELYGEMKGQAQREARWTEFDRQCTQLLPVLDHMTWKGMKIDAFAQAFLQTKLEGERDALYAKIQASVPPSMLKVKVYKRKPPKTLPFNPGSHVQRKALFRELGLSVPKAKGGEETTQAKHLRKHEKRFPVLRIINEWAERQKLITSYMWPLDANGRVHPVFNFNPTTWRKGCSDPNIQTIPKRSDLAKEFRRLFIAAPGCVLIEVDSAAIEAVLVGYFAGSQRYIDLAKRGVHKWLAEKIAGRPVSKDEPLYDQVKRVVHLSNYKGSAKRIAEEYPETFPTVKSAAAIQDFYFGTPEGQDVAGWQSETMARAHKEHLLETPFKQRHYFYDVYAYRDGRYVMGDDAKRAVAFMPQATASAIQTAFVLALPDFRPLRAIIHDSIIAEVPESDALAFAGVLYRTMTAPIPELGGLTIGAEAKIGPNLAEMEVQNF